MRPFHPRADYDAEYRPTMHLNEEDGAKIKRGRWTAIVTDQLSGQKFKVAGANCGIPRCMCDAVILDWIAE